MSRRFLFCASGRVRILVVLVIVDGFQNRTRKGGDHGARARIEEWRRGRIGKGIVSTRQCTPLRKEIPCACPVFIM